MTKDMLYLISKKDFVHSEIRQLISDHGVTFRETKPGTLMTDIYLRKPSILLVDLDSVELQGIESIESTLQIEFVPTLYFYTKFKTEWMGIITKGHILSFSKLRSMMPELFEFTAMLSKEYYQLSGNYDMLRQMNEEFESIVNQHMTSFEEDESLIIKKYLNLVYDENSVRLQKPTYFFAIHQEEDGVMGWMVDYSGLEEESIYLKCKGINIRNFIQKAAEAGLYVNFDLNYLSDINTLDQIVPNMVIDIGKIKSSNIQNVTSFAMNDTLFIGMNYSKEITAHDLAIFKGVCDKLNVLKVIKSNMMDLQDSFVYTMDALARAAESKDDITGHHIKRVNDYSVVIAKVLNMNPVFVNNIKISAQMHDVGKISISEKILNKPGKLTEEEFCEMKRHTIYGESIIGESKYLKMAREIAKYHHEKFDGSGYPEGLIGMDIPISARIVSLADIYDALRSPRSYKPGYTHEMAYEIITVGDGRVEPRHFDPEVLEAFISNHLEFKTIYDSNAD